MPEQQGGADPDGVEPAPSTIVNTPSRSSANSTSGAPAMTVRSRSLFSRNARSWRRRSVTSRR